MKLDTVGVAGRGLMRSGMSTTGAAPELGNTPGIYYYTTLKGRYENYRPFGCSCEPKTMGAYYGGYPQIPNVAYPNLKRPNHVISLGSARKKLHPLGDFFSQLLTAGIGAGLASQGVPAPVAGQLGSSFGSLFGGGGGGAPGVPGSAPGYQLPATSTRQDNTQVTTVTTSSGVGFNPNIILNSNLGGGISGSTPLVDPRTGQIVGYSGGAGGAGAALINPSNTGLIEVAIVAAAVLGGIYLFKRS